MEIIYTHFTLMESRQWGLILWKPSAWLLFKFCFQPKRQPLEKTQSLMMFCILILLTPFKSFNKVVALTNIFLTETFPLWKTPERSQADSYPGISDKHTKCNLWHSTKGHLEVLWHVELIIKNWQESNTWRLYIYQRYLLQNTEKESKQTNKQTNKRTT